MRRWRNLLITAAVAGVAGFAGAAVGARSFEPRAHHTPLVRASVADLARDGLELTPEQKRELAAIEKRHAERRMVLRGQIGHANRELAGAMSEEMAFGPQAQTAIDHLQDSLGQLQSATVLYLLEVRDVLTPQQRVVYDRKVVQALTDGVL